MLATHTPITDRFRAASRAYRDASREMRHQLDVLGYPLVTAEQGGMLAALAEREMTVGNLAREAYSGTNASYNVRRLQDYGLIVAEAVPTDGRTRLLRLTEAGRRLAGALKGEARP